MVYRVYVAIAGGLCDNKVIEEILGDSYGAINCPKNDQSGRTNRGNFRLFADFKSNFFPEHVFLLRVLSAVKIQLLFSKT